MGEIWSIKKHRLNSDMYGIRSNKSNWYIAEEMLKKHAELVVKLFNESRSVK